MGSSQTLLLGKLFGEIWELRCKVLGIITRKEKKKKKGKYSESSKSRWERQILSWGKVTNSSCSEDRLCQTKAVSGAEGE